jgi:hypothetical protein
MAPLINLNSHLFFLTINFEVQERAFPLKEMVAMLKCGTAAIWPLLLKCWFISPTLHMYSAGVCAKEMRRCGCQGKNSKSKSLSGSDTMGLGNEELGIYRLSVMVADSAEKATACQRVPQPTEQNRLQSIPIAISISIPMMRSPN